MLYEEYHNVGQVSKTKQYEGTPEEIAKLIHLLNQNTQDEKPSLSVQGNKKYAEATGPINGPCSITINPTVSIPEGKTEKEIVDVIKTEIDKTHPGFHKSTI